MGQWDIQIPVEQWLTLNKTRGHWAGPRRIARRLRHTAYTFYLDAGLPKQLQRIYVAVQLQFRVNRTRDPENFEPTVKPIIDALGPPRRYRSPQSATGWVNEPGIALIPGDDPRYLVRSRATIGDPLGRADFAPPGLVTISITDIRETLP